MEMIIWTTVAVLPINSVINPIIFVVVSLKKIFNWREKKAQVAGNVIPS